MRTFDKTGKEYFFHIREFATIAELRRYIADTPVSETWAHELCSSTSHHNDKWAGCTWDESETLLAEGWRTEVQSLNQKLRASDYKTLPKLTQQKFLDVAGYAPVVPLAMNGIPTSMVNRRPFPGRDRVITVDKSIAYHAGISQKEIREESAKALALVRRLEQQGYSVNLNVVWFIRPSDSWMNDGYGFKVRIKNANERLNIAKVAFPLVHPGFLRRTMFAVLEREPGVPPRYTSGYGKPNPDTETERLLERKEVLLPAFIGESLMKIRDADTLANALNIES